jgi:hypothetical protein
MPPAAPDDFNPKSHDAMFAVILTRLDAVIKRLEDGNGRMDNQDKVLESIEKQVIKTNGRVTASEAAIKAVEVVAKEAVAKSCPGKCITLEEKVRTLEDARLAATSTAGGVRWALSAVWASLGAAASAAVWWLSRKE